MDFFVSTFKANKRQKREKFRLQFGVFFLDFFGIMNKQQDQRKPNCQPNNSCDVLLNKINGTTNDNVHSNVVTICEIAKYFEGKPNAKGCFSLNGEKTFSRNTNEMRILKKTERKP